MATIRFYIRCVLKDKKKIEELLDALNDSNTGISISEEEVKFVEKFPLFKKLPSIK